MAALKPKRLSFISSNLTALRDYLIKEGEETDALGWDAAVRFSTHGDG